MQALKCHEQGGFALRLAIAAALTTYLVMSFQTPEPALTVYLVFFMNKPDRVSSILTQLIMLAFITVLIGGILCLATWVIDAPFWRVTSMAVLSIGFLFLGSASKLKPFAATLALITGYSLDLLGSVPSGEAAVRGLLYAWLFVAIPIAVSFIVNLLIAPSPVAFARWKINERLRLAKDVLATHDPEHQKHLSVLLLEGNAAIHQWLKLTAIEHTSPDTEIEKLRRLSVISFEMLTLLSIHREEVLNPMFQTTIEGLVAALQSQLHSRHPLQSINPPQNWQHPGADKEHVSLARGLTSILYEFNHPTPPLKQANKTVAPAGFFFPDAFTNPSHIHYALRTTAAAMTCYFLYNIMDWPGIHTCLITCYIVSLGTAAESVLKLRLRIAGCLLGAALGISIMIELIPYITSIESLILIVFAGTLLAGWVSAGAASISYAGFQIAFAFYLCVLQGASPEFDLSIARDRIIGVLLGNGVAYLFLTTLWPLSIGGRLDKKLLELFKALPILERRSACDFYANAGQLRAELDLARMEPSGIRPRLEEIKLREAMVDQGLKIASDMLSYQSPPPECAIALTKFHQNLAFRLSGPPMDSRDIADHKQPSPSELSSLSKLEALAIQIHPLMKSVSHV